MVRRATVAGQARLLRICPDKSCIRGIFDVLVLQPIDLEHGRFMRVGLGKYEQVPTKPQYTSLDEEEPRVFNVE